LGRQGLKKRHKKLLKVLNRNKKPLNTKEIAEKLKYKNAPYDSLKFLRRNAYVRKIKAKKLGGYDEYKISPKGRKAIKNKK